MAEKGVEEQVLAMERLLLDSGSLSKIAVGPLAGP